MPPAVPALGEEESPKVEPSSDELKDDILVSLKQVRAGQVIDADQSLRDIRRELGVDDN